jgi:hypothetical protein
MFQEFRDLTPCDKFRDFNMHVESLGIWMTYRDNFENLKMHFASSVMKMTQHDKFRNR